MCSIKRSKLLILAAAAGSLAACSSSDDGGGGGAGAGNGLLSASITDAAVDQVTAVNLRVTALRLRAQDAAEDDFVEIDLTDPDDGSALEFNLLEFQQGEAFTLFEDEEIPAGLYEHARLMLEAPAQTPVGCSGQDPLGGSHVVETGGGVVAIFIPSGAQTGVKLASPFRVPENGENSIVIDFDLRQALFQPPAFQCYFLRPAFRVLEGDSTGRIVGDVSPTLLDNSNGLCSDEDPQTGNAVYVYEGHDQTPGDLDGVDDATADPFATGQVVFDMASGDFDYAVAFLPPGDYTVAFTCKADLERLPDPESDDPQLMEADDELDFQQPQNVTVDTQTPAPADFGVM